MSSVRTLLTGLVLVLAIIAAGDSTAHAQRRMLVLIDASGSMTTVRPSDSQPRFTAAKDLATQRVLEQAAAPGGLTGVAVYTFRDASSTLRTLGGFVSVNNALDAIEALDITVDVGGVTPLAGSMCDAVDTLVAAGAGTRILQVSSDGEENATPLGHLCQGPDSASNVEPFTAGSWQNLVLTHAENNVIVRIDLFNDVAISGFGAGAKRASHDPEAGVTTQFRAATPAGAVALQPPTLEEFFTVLARRTGGQLVIAADTAPVPLTADLNGDQCVDRNDAILLARQFGKTGAAFDGKFDLSVDGKIGFADYELLLANRTAGCGPKDPFVTAPRVVCSALQKVVIDGKAIENRGVTIDARLGCHVVIKNSMIVSGQNAIQISGGATITVDNSLLVGENAVLVLQGGAILSAGNTIFHGAKKLQGILTYIDRGGNTWE